MGQVIDHLLALQRLQGEAKPLSSADAGRVLQLREKVPARYLDRFDRLTAHAKKAVAFVRNGVCSECHLQIPSGTLADLAYSGDVHLCDHCGRFLYLPEDAPLGLVSSNPPGKRVADPGSKRAVRDARHKS